MDEKSKLGGGMDHSVIKSLPPIEIDCSEWMNDVPAEDWSHGEFAHRTRRKSLVNGASQPNISPSGVNQSNINSVDEVPLCSDSKADD